MKTPLNNILSIIPRCGSVHHIGSTSQCPSVMGQHQNYLPGLLECNTNPAHGGSHLLALQVTPVILISKTFPGGVYIDTGAAGLETKIS